MIIQNLAEEFVKWRDGNCREDGAGMEEDEPSEMRAAADHSSPPA